MAEFATKTVERKTDKNDNGDMQQDADNIEVIEIRKKPDFSITSIARNDKLLSRTSALLQQMKKSNQELEQKISEAGKESVIIERTDDKDDGNYIDFDLYVGVLEEKKAKDNATEIKQRTDKLLGLQDSNSTKSVVISEVEDDSHKK